MDTLVIARPGCQEAARLLTVLVPAFPGGSAVIVSDYRIHDQNI